jgi:hypothetical protein
VNGCAPARPAPTGCDATGVHDALRDVLHDDGFWLAFVVASVVAALTLPLARSASVRLGFAAVVVVAAFVALAVDYDLWPRLAIGVLLVGAAGLVRDDVEGCLLPGALLVLGAASVASAPPGVALWMRCAAFITIAVAVPCASVVDRRAPRLLPLVAAITVVGVYVCVPDTELPLVLVGAVLPATLLALDPDTRASAWTGAVVALVVAEVLVGGEGRPGAIIGGLACVGVLLLAPLAAWRPHATRDGLVLLITHAVFVLWAARVAGFRDSAWIAALLCAPAAAIAWGVLFVTARLGARSASQ